MSLPLLLSLACTGWGADDTAEPCTDDCLNNLGLQISTQVPMGVRATWETGTDGQCHVEYREVDGPWWTSPSEDCGLSDDRTHVDLRGLHADTDVEVIAILSVDGVEHSRETATATTGPLPENVPTFTVEVPWSGDGDGGYVQGSFSEEQAGVFVLDRDGRYVYLWMNEANQKRDLFNARLTPDLSAFWLLLNQSRVAAEWGLLVRRNWFGEVKRTAEVSWIHHDLLPLEDGSVLVIEGDPDDLEEEVPIWGERIVRVFPDDTQTVVWSTWDDLEPPEREEGASGWFGPGVDWIHANSLGWNAERETVLMGSAQLDTLFEVDGAGGGLVRTFGGDLPDTLPVDGAPFEHPHGAHWTADGDIMLVSTDGSEKVTSAMRYRVDEEAGVLTPTWSHASVNDHAKVGGNAALSGDGGNVLIDYGSALVVTEVDAEGETLWRVQAQGTAVIFQAWPLPSLWPVIE